MITPQDILKLIGIPVTDQGTFGDNLVMFPTDLSTQQFLELVRSREFQGPLNISIIPMTAIVYHKNIFVASVGYWAKEEQSALLVKIAGCVSVQACEAIQRELAEPNPFIAYIKSLEIAF